MNKLLRKRAISAFNTLAWANVGTITTGNDADDFVQSVIIAQTLIACGGFDHADFVKRLRQPFSTKIGGMYIPDAGCHSTYTGQIRLLLDSTDPLYLAQNGITDGAAMRTLPCAIRYHGNFGKLVKSADSFASVTHGEPEARLPAVIVALRMWQLLNGVDDMAALLNDTKKAMRLIDYGAPADFIYRRLKMALLCAQKPIDPEDVFLELVHSIGIGFFGFSCPLAAVAWSFVIGPAQKKFIYKVSKKGILIKGKNIDGTMHPDKLRDLYNNHLIRRGLLADMDERHWNRWNGNRRRLDLDTFFSICFSIVGIKRTDFLNSEEVKMVQEKCESINIEELVDNLLRS